ncbi:MAG: hypothetical protein OXR66_04215 [Candidatus Woesearchaeota archaeon]|nr:hypothetical protein [Candidatus Woesearchaeota archaeon]
MSEIRFSEDGRQQGTITSHSLDAEELRMISAAVNWDSPNDWAEYVYECAGRSVFFRSPTRNATVEDTLRGDFDGLQLIGAGGNFSRVQNRISLRESVVVQPVNSENHAHIDPLNRIGQLREFAADGSLVLTYRTYMPLHGMDQGEAEKRETYTGILRSIVNAISQQSRNIGFVVPELAAKGILEGHHDDVGNPLPCQVYRVPRTKRFAGQIIQEILDEAHGEPADFNLSFQESQYFMGKALRNFHGLGLAYMDSHPGNFSLLKGTSETKLYLTDLGSISNIGNDPHYDKYRALDVYLFLQPMFAMAERLEAYLRSDFGRSFLSDSSKAMTYFTYCTLRGYFSPEEKKHGEQIVDRDVNALAPYVTECVRENHIQEFCDVFSMIPISAPTCGNIAKVSFLEQS